MAERGKTQNPATLFLIAGGVLLFGLVMLGSATAPVAQERFGSAYYFLLRQVLYGLLPGLLLFYIFRRIPFTVWERLWKPMFWVSVGLLGLVFIPGLGLRINNSLSWIHVGWFSLQPAELVKLTFIIFLAGWLANNEGKLARPFQEGLLIYFFYVAIICGLLLLQPDLGTMCVFFGTATILAFVVGLQWKHLGILAGAGAILVVVMVAVAPYRLQRITTLFDPDKDPLGSGYHLRQSLVAIGGGGFMGLGFGNSRQKFQYLPEVSADSIFAIVAEETGFIISALLVIAYLVMILKGYGLARSAPSLWARYFIIGTMSWLGVQVFFNIGAMVGILPLTGLPLPLVSHGGSALMVTLAAFGVVAAIVWPAPIKSRAASNR